MADSSLPAQELTAQSPPLKGGRWIFRALRLHITGLLLFGMTLCFTAFLLQRGVLLPQGFFSQRSAARTSDELVRQPAQPAEPVAGAERDALVQAAPVKSEGRSSASSADGHDYILEQGVFLKKTLSWLDTRYLESSLLSPPQLLEAGLEGLARVADDVLWTPPTGERPGALLVGRRTLMLQPTHVESLSVLATEFTRVLTFYKQARELLPDDDVEIEYAVIRGVLSRLDRPTMLLAGNRLDEFKIRSKGSISGIGCTVGIRNEKPTVVKVVEDSPSAAAGLQVDDRIVRIDGVSTVNMGTNDVVTRIRGISGTWVVLDIERGKEPTTIRMRIMRDRVKLDNVEVALLDNGIGYVSLANFSDETLSNFRMRLSKIAPRWKGLNGLVMDLRQNGGGSLKQSAYMVDEFVSNGTIVRTEGRSSQVMQELVREIVARPDQLMPDIPLAILVGPKTASGAEILSGALKYLNRAVLIGQRTYGKGSVQQEYPLNRRASVKMTVARYLLPQDHFIHAIGLQPDIILVPVVLEKNALRFLDAGMRQDDDDDNGHEIVGSTEVLSAPTIQLYYPQKPTGEVSEVVEDRIRDDFEVQFAAGLLLSAPSPTREGMLAQGQAYLSKVQTERELELMKLLSEQGLDWRGAAGTLGARAVVQAYLEPTMQVLKAGQEASLVLSVTNEGVAPYHRLRASSHSPEPLFSGLQFFFGQVLPGETRTWKVPVKVPLGSAGGVRQLRFDFVADGEVPPPLETGLMVQAGAEPLLEAELSYEDLAPGQAGHHNRLLEPGEQGRLNVVVSNVGSGPSGEVTLTLRNPSQKELELKEARVSLEPLAPGQKRTATLSFELLKGEPSSGTSARQVTMMLLDRSFNTRLERTLDFGAAWTGKLTMVAPRLSLSSATPSDTLKTREFTLTGQVAGLHSIQHVSLFRGRQKLQRLLPAVQTGKPTQVFQFSMNVPLLPGSNRLELVCEDEVGLRTTRQLWLRAEPTRLASSR